VILVSALLLIGEFVWMVTYVASCGLLLGVLDTVELVDTRAVSARVATEGDVQCLEEGVATGEQGLGCVGVRLNGRRSSWRA
jgi:hypothetical protein